MVFFNTSSVCKVFIASTGYSSIMLISLPCWISSKRSSICCKNLTLSGVFSSSAPAFNPSFPFSEEYHQPDNEGGGYEDDGGYRV